MIYVFEISLNKCLTFSLNIVNFKRKFRLWKRLLKDNSSTTELDFLLVKNLNIAFEIASRRSVSTKLRYI